MAHLLFIYVLTLVVGFLMSCAVGANDVANAMGTSVGSRVLTIKQAVIAAAIFEGLGAFLGSRAVTHTIQNSLFDVTLFKGNTILLIYGMLASLLAAATWLILATYYRLPVSTTHSIIGAIIGFTAMGLGIHHVHWEVIWQIISAWVVTPIFAGFLAYFLFISVQRFILSMPDPINCARRLIPLYLSLVVFVISFVVFNECNLLFHYHLSASLIYLMTFCVSMLASGLSMLYLACYYRARLGDIDNPFDYAEKMFRLLVIGTACAMAFAHGSNDVANAIGPMAAIINLIQGDLALHALSQPIPLWLLALGASGVLIGLLIYGYRVIETIGTQITQLTPTRGFAAQLATAMTVIVASQIGLPVSTTHILVGAILGVGMARGLAAIDLNVVRSIFLSWIVTVPLGAMIAIVFFYILVALL